MWSDFKSKNPHLARSPTAIETMTQLVNDGWDWDLATSVLELPKTRVEEVLSLTKAGTPPAVALELVALKSAEKQESSKPRTAHLVNGAEDPVGNPASLDRNTYRKKSYHDRLDESVAKHSRK